jgi:hypothetical protein
MFFYFPFDVINNITPKYFSEDGEFLIIIELNTIFPISYRVATNSRYPQVVALAGKSGWRGSDVGHIVLLRGVPKCIHLFYDLSKYRVFQNE